MCRLERALSKRRIKLSRQLTPPSLRPCKVNVRSAAAALNTVETDKENSLLEATFSPEHIASHQKIIKDLLMFFFFLHFSCFARWLHQARSLTSSCVGIILAKEKNIN